MNELPAKIRGMYHVSKTDIQFVRREALKLCDAHERLEAEHAGVTTDLEGVTLMLANTSFELRRLEGLLRALGTAEIARRKVVEENVWKDRSEYFRAVDDAIHVVCDEAVRLAKATP